MPRRRRYRRRRPRRKKRYGRRKRRKQRIPRLPFGRSKVVRHRMCLTDVIVTTPSALPAQHVFRTNSLYDPDYTSLTGPQPFWYDEMSLIYNHWTVIGFKIKITARQNSNITTALLMCLDSDSSSIGTPEAVRARMEQGTCKKRIINGANQAGDTSICRMSYACAPNKFLGIPNPVGNSLVRGTNTSNPEEEAYLKIVAYPLQAGVASLSLFCELEYIAVWTEPKNAAGS